MDANRRVNVEDEERSGGQTDPGPDTVDPAPLLGQVGEGATLESGEAIAREFRKLTESSDEQKTDENAAISADPEMPIPDPD
jgi:hypothetical protein